MSQKIDWNKYDNTEEAGTGFPKVEPGVYLCKVVQVEDVEDKQYMKIFFDIDKGKYQKQFAEMAKAFGKYPNAGITYRSYKPSAYGFLKNFATAIEKSNAGYSFRATNGDFQSFVGKLFIGVFGEEEIPIPDDDGKPIVMTKLQTIRSTEAAANGEVKVPEGVKKLNETQLKEFQAALEESSIQTNDYTKSVIKERSEQPAKSDEFYETSKKLTAEEDLPF